MTDPLPLGATIGILGGGQLGRMLAVAAARLGFHAHVFDPAAAGPAAEVSREATAAAYDDEAALEAFARSVDVVTYEFENVPAAALARIAALVAIRPPLRALETSQDRLEEKDFLTAIGLPVAPFAPVDTLAGLRRAKDEVGLPAILKTRRFGYDGKGQVRIDRKGQAAAAWAEIREEPAILERVVAFEREISVIAARAADGTIRAYDPGENLHEAGILRRTTVPAALPPDLAMEGLRIAERLLVRLDYVGVIGVELFVTADGLLVNEFAPRVHNSGHWTQTGCAVDQFEQHIRAVAGWPLGTPARHSDVVMENLIGADLDDLPRHLAEGGQIHLYGKPEARPGRKMGHVTRITGPARSGAR